MSATRKRVLWLACAFSLCLAATALAQKKKLALEDLTAEPPLSGRSVSGVTWLADGRSFSYVVRKGAGEEAISELVVEDARTGVKKTAVTAASLTLPEEPRPGEAAPAVEKQPPAGKPRRASLEGYRWSPDGKILLLSGDNDP